MPYYSGISQKYTYLWSKYRPAILKLMIDSVNEPQEYKFLKHEFEAVNAKEKGGYTFVLRVFESKALNLIKDKIVAKDLLIILQQSKKAIELTSTATYEFMLDKQFVLHIKQEPIEEVEEVKEEEGKEEN